MQAASPQFVKFPTRQEMMFAVHHEAGEETSYGDALKDGFAFRHIKNVA